MTDTSVKNCMWKEKELMGSVLSGELEHSVLGPDWHGCGILLKGFLLDLFLIGKQGHPPSLLSSLSLTSSMFP